MITLVFTACGSSENTSADYDKDYLTSISDTLLDQVFPSTTEEQIEQINKIDDFAFQYQLYQMQMPLTPESYIESCEAWLSAVKECGTYQGHGDYLFEVDSDGIVVKTTATFADRQADIIFRYGENSYLESMTISADYTTGEILEKAGLNTVLGMGTVFSVLIFISIIISFMKFIPKLQAAFTKKDNATTSTESSIVTETVAPVVSTPMVDTSDSELVAVISAAIAEAQGVNQSDFIVRSIIRRPSNKW